MSKFLVSICIPTYKQTQYLNKCLDSILSQDFKNFELIISDDTPNDYIEQFLISKLKNVPYVYHRNSPSLGTPENWNFAVSKANGKYIKIMHHDDFFTQPTSLSLMVNELESNKASFLFCQTDVWYSKANTHRIQKVSDKQFRILKNKPELLFFKNIIGAPSATIYLNNKFIYDKNFKWLVDIDFYLQFLFNKQSIIYLNKTLVSTIHDADGQVTGTVINDKNIQLNEHVLLYNKIKNYIHNGSNFVSFFDYLFFKYNITTFKELERIVPSANENKLFFISIINELNKNRKWKTFKKRFFESRYNNYIFKFEQFI